ncbi:GNAT family N-acetyltransferase [Acetobacterium wieringae]|uniref:N-acetyltransferase domain-containing protein n=1 Tax=Acetobacterium wieringae TaxID=52694 RepID=A0A1F2PIK2_9FIRM|nr:GNAT family N-acetyltransferase [Acetobacterium wieringae]OFV70885.1 hypothetical protein ACWI_14710 [Acetobacterium wieringae]
MEITIKVGQELSIEAFQAILDLDCKIYGDDILTNQGMALKRFIKFPEGIIVAYSGEVLAGFISFFGVDESVYQRAVSNQEYIDDNLNENEVVPLEKGRGNYILILDLAVDEIFRHQGISKQLHDQLWDYLKQKQNQGFPIERVFCFAITNEGCKSMSNLGGQAIWTRNQTTLFELDQELVLGQL